MLKNLLLYRMAIFNASLAGLMAWLASQGYVSLIFASDPTGISLGIVALFLIAMVSTCMQLWKITKDKNAVKAGTAPSRDKKRGMKLERIDKMADTMSLLGIIGTVVGFIIAFSGIDPSSLLSASGVGANVAGMMKGMGIALYTTLTGAVLGGWTSWNHSMLKEQVDILQVDESRVGIKQNLKVSDVLAFKARAGETVKVTPPDGCCK